MAFDRTNPADLQALQTEVNTDPTGKGYAAVIDDTNALLDLLNGKTETVEKPAISAADIRAATTFEAYDGLLADRQEWLRWMTGSNGFGEENVTVTPDLKLQLTGDGTPENSIWAAGERAAMVAAMDALINVAGSRAEVLFGYATIISRDDWIAARNYTP